MMTRLTSIFLLAGLLTACPQSQVSGQFASPPNRQSASSPRRSILRAAAKPNVVFFLVDDLGIMDIGAYNPKTFYETPNVDRLAREGMRFTNGYAANPVCSFAFSPDGKRLASVGWADKFGEVKLWDPEIGAEVLTFRLYPEWFTTVKKSIQSSGAVTHVRSLGQTGTVVYRSLKAPRHRTRISLAPPVSHGMLPYPAGRHKSGSIAPQELDGIR
jgi:WD40 repeat protein